MQPRFAALLFVLGLADLAYVNLGLGHEVFGDAASGAASGRDAPAPPRPLEGEPVAAPAPVAAPSPTREPVATPSPAPEPVAAPSPEPAPVAARPAPSSAPPSSQALGLPAPAAPMPPAAPAPAPPSEVPAPRLDDAPPTEPAPSAEAAPSAPRPALAGLDGAPAEPAATSAAATSAAPVASAAGLPDAELTVPFPDTASWGLTDEARDQLLMLAAKLRANPEYRIHIVGHADSRGSREFNRDLGGRRARAVVELLARAGVRREQLEAESRGEDQPKEVGTSEQVWAVNRRVEISIGIERSTAP
jgi:outer membrane protein OmpA-like peptidoglycan-associated protein